jgi:redox-sensitive bicupin YhaK (pirin superfamily)
MLTIRRDAQIYRQEADGFVLRFHFSFKDYQDPAYDGFGALRLFNDDRKSGVLPNHMHRHAETEVVTYIVEGMFRHQDSQGNSFVLPAGSVECLSAGTGIEHAEHNASETDPLRMILMYFVPETHALPAAVTHEVFTQSDRKDNWRHIAGPPGCEDISVVIHQQAHVYAAALTPPEKVRHVVMSGRGAYLYVIDGQVQIDDWTLDTGDAAIVTDQPYFEVETVTPCEFLLVDVPLLTVSAQTDTAIKGDVRVTDGADDPVGQYQDRNSV